MIELPDNKRVFDPFGKSDWSDAVAISDLSEVDWSRFGPFQEPLPWSWDGLISRYDGWLTREAIDRWIWLCAFARAPGEFVPVPKGEILESPDLAEAELYASLLKSPPPTRVFISYRSIDRRLANVLRSYLVHKGKRVWMDVWDPMINAATKLPAPIRTRLTAAIIEIALLSSTHLIVVHTSSTGTSTWVPYEIGRAKHRLPTAGNVAYWHDGARVPGYAYLVRRYDRVADAAAFARWVKSI